MTPVRTPSRGQRCAADGSFCADATACCGCVIPSSTPKWRLRAALTTLHWSGRCLAAILDRDERTIRRWISGDYEVPGDILAWVEQCAGFVRDHPAPPRSATTSAPDSRP